MACGAPRREGASSPFCCGSPSFERRSWSSSAGRRGAGRPTYDGGPPDLLPAAPSPPRGHDLPLSRPHSSLGHGLARRSRIHPSRRFSPRALGSPLMSSFLLVALSSPAMSCYQTSQLLRYLSTGHLLTKTPNVLYSPSCTMHDARLNVPLDGTGAAQERLAAKAVWIWTQAHWQIEYTRSCESGC